MTTKLDQIYLDNLAIDEDDVIDIEALQEKARASVQPSLFDLGAVNSLGYGIPPVNTLMSEEDKKFAKQIPQSVVKGSVMEVGGLAGDLLSIAKGLYNIPQDQMDQLMARIEDPEAEQEVLSKFDSFMRGFDDIKALNLPPLLGRTSEAIGEDLTEMGFDPKGEADSELKKKVLGAGEIVGQVGTPGVGLIPLVKGAKVVKNIAKSKEGVDKVKGATVVKKKITSRYNEYVGENSLDKAKKTFSFKVGMKDGKVIDSSGAPKVFYRSMNNKYKNFDVKKSYDGLGWFASDKKVAQSYNKEKKGAIREVYLKMKKPFIVENYSFTAPNQGIKKDLSLVISRLKRNVFDKNSTPRNDPGQSNVWTVSDEDIAIFRKNGYDGIIIPAEVNPRQEEYFLIFNNKQVINVESKKTKVKANE